MQRISFTLSLTSGQTWFRNLLVSAASAPQADCDATLSYIGDIFFLCNELVNTSCGEVTTSNTGYNMPIESIFTAVNATIIPFWLLLLFAPHSKPTNILVHSGVVPLLFGVIYIFYFVTSFILGSPEGASMNSIAGLQIAFSDPRTLVAAWVHYLVFDLFVGAWLVRDARREGIHHVAIVIPLLLTFMAGPLGLALYIALRGIWKRRFTLTEEP